MIPTYTACFDVDAADQLVILDEDNGTRTVIEIDERTANDPTDVAFAAMTTAGWNLTSTWHYDPTNDCWDARVEPAAWLMPLTADEDEPTDDEDRRAWEDQADADYAAMVGAA